MGLRKIDRPALGSDRALLMERYEPILCSDLGQTGIFSPLEGFQRGVKLCIELGYSDDEIHAMVSTNAAKAFDLEADVARVKARAQPNETPRACCGGAFVM